jgi:hypothetical protein
MSLLLFPLRGVPEDEAQDVREILSDHTINFYETSAGNWGLSNPALWLVDPVQLPEAKNLIAEYQQQRQAASKAEYQRLVEEGKNQTMLGGLKEHPLRFIVYFTLIFIVLYISVRLVLDVGF